jgi:hypothetical protein
MIPKEIAEVQGLQQLQHPEGPCIYFLVMYGRVIYVGQTLRLTSRVRAHRKSGKRFDRVFFLQCRKDEMTMYETYWILTLKKQLINQLNGNAVEALKQALDTFKRNKILKKESKRK